MSKKAKAEGGAAPKSETHCRETFHLPRTLVAKLNHLTGILKAEAVREGKPLPTMSQIVETALSRVVDAELKKREGK